MALIQTVHLSMANFKSAPVVPSVQNDTDRQVKMIIDDYTLTSGLTGKIAFERSDGTHYETAAELVLADNAFTADIDQALTQPGRTMVQLKVTDTLTVSTFSFVIFVEADNSGTVTPQEGIDLVTAVEAAEAAADRAEEAASTLELDATLTSATKAAQSKAVGDAVGEVKNALDDLQDITYIKSSTPLVYYEIGNLTSIGSNSSNRNTVRTSFVNAKAWSKISCNAGYLIRVYIYSVTDASFIERSEWITEYTVNNDCLLRVTIGDETNYNKSSYVLSDTSYSEEIVWDIITGTIADEIKINSDYITELQENMPSTKQILTMDNLTTGYYINGEAAAVGNNWTDYLVQNLSSLYLSTAYDVSEYIGDIIVIEIPLSATHSGIRGCGFCSSAGIVSTIIAEKNLSYVSDGSNLTAELEITDSFFFFSCSNKSSVNIYIRTKGNLYKEILRNQTLYVSPNGDDENDGTDFSPLASINKALKKGAKTICLKSGIYEEQIDLSLSTEGTVVLKNAELGQRVIIRATDTLVADSEASVSGYTKVYSSSITKTLSNNNILLFQDGVPDAITLIPDSERLPEQRGYVYRCQDTKITRCDSETLNEALAEIESSNEFKWYLDGTTLYFSRPQAVNETNPIRGSFNNTLFLNNSRKNTVIMSGIEIQYMRCNVDRTSGSRITDCMCKNVFGAGCFTWDDAIDAKFIRCEAAFGYNTRTTGDGFNGHTSISEVTDEFTKVVSVTLIDCWSHDNIDDGFSDHGGCESTIVGGLFEHNGSGITPSTGSVCRVYESTAQSNGSGFTYTNTANDSGYGGHARFYNCISKNNASYGYRSESGSDENPNIVTCIGCKSISDGTAFSTGTKAFLNLIDCSSAGATIVKTGNITVQDTTIVS